jgi:NitT/TauT family transport system substrate-binding protein
MKRHAVRLVSVLIAVAALTSGCSLESLSQSSGVVNVVVGYQSKTINTVTAGTLLRAQGYLEHRLAALKDSDADVRAYARRALEHDGAAAKA